MLQQSLQAHTYFYDPNRVIGCNLQISDKRSRSHPTFIKIPKCNGNLYNYAAGSNDAEWTSTSNCSLQPASSFVRRNWKIPTVCVYGFSELAAITWVLEYMTSLPPWLVVILWNSRGGNVCLSHPPSIGVTAKEQRRITCGLACQGHRVFGQWLPGHVRLPKNFRVDRPGNEA